MPAAPSASRPSTANSATRGGPNNQIDEPKEIWSNLLKSVSYHKSIPSRNLLVMGIFLIVSLNSSNRRGRDKRNQ